MIELSQITVRHGNFTLTADWSLTPGTHLAIIGPSGGGKSTLLNAIAGFCEDVTGAITWNGTPMPDTPGARPVAMLFQDHNLFPHLSAAQNVGLALGASLKLSTEELTRVETALQQVGLHGLGARRPADLSGGQQSRAALARILLMARPLILLDEPFSALGPAQRGEMLELVKTVAADLGASILMVTHDPGEARALGGMVSFVEAGTCHAPVPAPAFFESPPDGMRDYAGR